MKAWRGTWKGTILSLIICLGIWAALGMINASNHEELHRIVCENNGGVVTEMHIGVFTDSYTICEIVPTPKYESENMMVENIGYHFLTVNAYLFLILSALIIRWSR